MLKRWNSPAAVAYGVAVLSSVGALASLGLYGLKFDAALLAPYFLVLAIVEIVGTVSNLGLTQFIQRTASVSPCRGAGFVRVAFRLRFIASVVGGLAGVCYLNVVPAAAAIDLLTAAAVLLLAVTSGLTRLVADFLESDGAIVVAQLIRGANGSFRLAGLVAFSWMATNPGIWQLVVIELLACLLPGIAAFLYMGSRFRSVRDVETKRRLPFSELAAYGGNDWSYVLQSPALIRLCAAWFLSAPSLTLLSLAQSVINPLARYTPAVMLRGMWMSRASKAYNVSHANLGDVIRLAHRSNAVYLLAAVPVGICVASIYLTRATGQSFATVAGLSSLLIVAGAMLSFRVISEIELQVTGAARVVAQASIGGALLGLACGVLGYQHVFAWASVGLVATCGWWILSASMAGGSRHDPAGTFRRRDILFISRDMLPLWRVDISSLFGRYLPRHDWTVRWHVLHPEGECMPAWIQADAVSSIRLRKGRLLGIRRWLLERLRDLLAAAAVIKDPPSLVVVRDDYVSLLIVGIAARLKGVPCAYWMSFLMEDGYVELGRQASGLKSLQRTMYGRVYGWIGHWALRAFSAIVFAQSEVMAEIVAKRMKFRRRIVPVHMAVDFELLPHVPLIKNDPHTLVLGYTGVITLLRGFEAVLQGLALARDAGTPLRLVLVGWYETKKDQVVLERLIVELGLADVIEHMGKLSQTAACKVIGGCDVGLSPCPNTPLYAPGSPTKLFEYLALGRMVIASEHPLQRDVIETARAGWVVDHSAGAYAEAIKQAYAVKVEGEIAASTERLQEFCRARHSYGQRAELVSRELELMLST